MAIRLSSNIRSSTSSHPWWSHHSLVTTTTTTTAATATYHTFLFAYDLLLPAKEAQEEETILNLILEGN